MPRTNNLASLSLSDIRREMARRQRRGQSLLRKRDRMATKLRAMDTEIAELGITLGGSLNARGGVRRRPQNEMKLVEALAKVLDGKTMGVADVVEAVQKAGYRTGAANFRTIVNQALIASGKFKRVARGQYTGK